MSKELKPCPICTNASIDTDEMDLLGTGETCMHAICHECGASAPVDKWNARTESTELEQLRKERENLSVRYGDAWFDGFTAAKKIEEEDGNLDDYSKESILGLSEHAEELRAETEPEELIKLRKERDELKYFVINTQEQLSKKYEMSPMEVSFLTASCSGILAKLNQD